MPKQRKQTHHKKPHLDGRYLQTARTAFKRTAQITMTQEMQRQFWMWVVAANDVFGVGPKRIQGYLEQVQKIECEYQEMEAANGRVYADEKLRAKAELVSGIEISQWFGGNAVRDLRKEERRSEQ